MSEEIENKTARTEAEPKKETTPKPKKKRPPKPKSEKPKTAKDNTGQESVETDEKGGKFVINKENAKEVGTRGGIRSGESRRAKKDAKGAVRYMLDLEAKGKIKDNLRELGVERDDMTNMVALQARLFTMAMAGNIDAYMMLMKMGGFEPEENRKERESVSADRRREVELDAKVTALGTKGDNASMALSLNDEDDNSDVVIYMPQIASEESRQDESSESEKQNTEDAPADEE